MFLDEDADFKKPMSSLGVLTGLNLDTLSIEELEFRIDQLEKEIERTLKTIEQKKSHRAGIESLFGKGG